MKICFCLALFLIVTACATKPKEAADDAAVPVDVVPVKSGTMHDVVSGQAIIYPVNQATIVPKISSPVKKFLVQRGDHVKQGQLLAILEDSDLRATAVESQELYLQAQANLQNTRAAALPG